MRQIYHQWTKKIIHVDMDAFYAAVEQRDHPEWRGKPVIVGGDPHSRGVVSTASYEARSFGIHSAMPAVSAYRLCPQGIFVRPNFSKYQQVSEMIMNILRQYADLVEPVSLDEAYLDVTHNKLDSRDPVIIAALIKQNISAATKLSASAGVAPNPFLAKVASDFKKPDGLTVIAPDQVENFLKDLPVRKIPGVGPVTEKELHQLGIFTCGQLAVQDVNFLRREFGRTGLFLYQRAMGQDDRQIVPEMPSKQYSMEETFFQDVSNRNFLRSKLREYADAVFEALKNEGRMGRTLILKVKYYDFELITRSYTFSRFPVSSQELFDKADELLNRRTLVGKKAIRLIGLGMSKLEDLSKIEITREPDLFNGGIFL